MHRVAFFRVAVQFFQIISEKVKQYTYHSFLFESFTQEAEITAFLKSTYFHLTLVQGTRLRLENLILTDLVMDHI